MVDQLFKHYEVKSVSRLQILKGLINFVNNPIPVIDDAIQEYGPTYISRIFNGSKLIMTIDPEVIQHVLQKNHKNYKKSAIQTESLGKYLGNGLLTANGAYWLKQRRLIQPGFHKSKMEGLVRTMKSELDLFMNDLKLRIESSPTVEVSDTMMELTLRIVSKSLFSTGISHQQIIELGRSFTELQKYIIKEIRQPIFNWWRKMNGSSNRAIRLAEEVKDILRAIISDRMSNPSDQDDLLDMLINSCYQDTGERMSEEQLLDEALILFTAGHETTANSLSWTLYELAKTNSSIIDKIRAEYSEIETCGVSMDSLRSASYITMVLSESMRLYPPAWILDRVALEDDRVKNIKIAKGDVIGMYVYGTHRSNVIWTHPDQFQPDRFSPEAMKNHHSFAYFPFGGGPRLCIGSHFAMLEMQLALGCLVSQFDFELDDDIDVILQPLITLRPKHGIRMSFKTRDPVVSH